MNDQFGFGCMRLPLNEDGTVNYDTFKMMIDKYMEEGFTYFDTAHGYVQKQSETAIRDCLVARYPRESYILTDKLSTHYFEKEEEIIPLFNHQLERCGVDYFDYYLMHAQDRNIYEKFKKCHAYEIGKKLKEEGKIKHLGISFHDSAEVLDKILSEQPDIEVVQIQFNYIDYLNAGVQSKAVYDVCRKYNKPVIVMEPIKGGSLVNLPDAAKKVWDDLNGGYSYAGYALRFCASHEGMFKVLSGMGNMEQLEDNMKTMKDMKPFTPEEYDAVNKVRDILNSLGGIPCTSCRYCTEVCPMQISIPDLFGCFNGKKIFNDWNAGYYYSVHTKTGGTPEQCLQCGQCESVCPQHLNIIELLQTVKDEFTENN